MYTVLPPVKYHYRHHSSAHGVAWGSFGITGRLSSPPTHHTPTGGEFGWGGTAAKG